MYDVLSGFVCMCVYPCVYVCVFAGLKLTSNAFLYQSPLYLLRQGLEKNPELSQGL